MKLSTDLPSGKVASLRTLELRIDDAPLLQQFFDANPAYFLAVQGEPAGSDEAKDEIAGELPVWLTYSKKFVIGYQDHTGSLVAMANLLSNIFVPGVWNLSTFIVATAHHGTGLAPSLYRELETWTVACGAHWLRLGVVKGNVRAERFWQAQGFVDTRERHGYQIGNQVNVLRVMMKPLAGGTLADYLDLVPRDRPEPHAA
ncbi:GNAT family N-acetyltransferase [Roseateles sp.]|uniref:GNAT family N-acetyltransferase n=1 Tax=Roseateles sp. TaxID=1971397 RepID=UPI003BA77BBA